MQSDRSRNRFVILLGCALLSVFGSNMAQFSGAGALGVLVMATVASYGWGDSEKVGQSVMKSMPASIALEYHDKVAYYCVHFISSCKFFDSTPEILKPCNYFD